MNASQFYQGQLTLSEVMDQPKAVLQTDTTLDDAAAQLRRSGHRNALVRDGRGDIVGIVSINALEQRLQQSVDGNEPAWQSRSVEMLTESRCLTRGRAVPATAAETAGISCTPVFEDGRLMAVMTPDDVLVSWDRMDSLVRTATTDELTGLMNRHTFVRRVSDELDRSRRTQEPLSLLLIDLDWFKEINDTEGHLIGDAVLSEVGSSLWSTLRRCDAVARVGGDEFAALCCACGTGNIAAPVNRIVEAVGSIEVPSDRVRNVSLSIGAACIESNFQDLDDEQLFGIADKALYAAKAAGRNTAFFSTIEADGLTCPQRVDCDREQRAIERSVLV